MKNNYYFYQTDYNPHATLFLVADGQREQFIKKFGHLVKQIPPIMFCKKINTKTTKWSINTNFAKEEV